MSGNGSSSLPEFSLEEIKEMYREAKMSGNGSSSLPEFSLEEIKEMYREALKKHIAELESKIEAATRGRRRKAKNDAQGKEHAVKKIKKEMDKEFQAMMEECNARGFVYLVRTETGVITGASESLNSWWSETLNSHWNETVGKDSEMDKSE